MNTQATASNFHAPEPEGSFMAQHSPGSGDVVKRLRCGDLGPDGKIFWAYKNGCRNGQIWVSPEIYTERKRRASEKHAQRMRDDPEYRQKRERYRYAYCRDPKNIAALRARSKKAQVKYYATDVGKARRNAYLAKRRATDLTAALTERVRTRLGRALKQAVIHRRSSRSVDAEGIAFLRWDFERRGLAPDSLSLFHIDHIIPLMLWEKEPRSYGCNSPENVRWLPARENMQKKISLPTPEELQAHLLLVAEWRKSLIEQKQVVPENKIATL